MNDNVLAMTPYIVPLSTADCLAPVLADRSNVGDLGLADLTNASVGVMHEPSAETVLDQSTVATLLTDRFSFYSPPPLKGYDVLDYHARVTQPLFSEGMNDLLRTRFTNDIGNARYPIDAMNRHHLERANFAQAAELGLISPYTVLENVLGPISEHGNKVIGNYWQATHSFEKFGGLLQIFAGAGTAAIPMLAIKDGLSTIEGVALTTTGFVLTEAALMIWHAARRGGQVRRANEALALVANLMGSMEVIAKEQTELAKAAKHFAPDLSGPEMRTWQLRKEHQWDDGSRVIPIFPLRGAVDIEAIPRLARNTFPYVVVGDNNGRYVDIRVITDRSVGLETAEKAAVLVDRESVIASGLVYAANETNDDVFILKHSTLHGSSQNEIVDAAFRMVGER